MRYYNHHRRHHAVAMAALLSYVPFADSLSDKNQDVACDNDQNITHQQSTTASYQTAIHKPILYPSYSNPFSIGSIARCEAVANTKQSDEDVLHDTPTNTSPPTIDHYYMKMNPNDIERTSMLDSHAVFGALWGEGLVERYDVYRRVNVESIQRQEKSSATVHEPHELTVVDLKLGSRLNGHGGIAHGGIISLLFDEAMGWAYECLVQDERIDSSIHMAVTANLQVNFRKPFYEGSEAVIRVHHDETKGRKIYFSAILESSDGKVVYAEAKSLFILVKSDQMKTR